MRNLSRCAGVLAALVLVIGGLIVVPVSSVKAQPTTGWTIVNPAPLAVSAPATVGCQGAAYMAGGYIKYVGYQNEFAKYDPVANQWTTLASLPDVTASAGAACVGSKVYVFGGTDSVGRSTNLTRIYDIASNSWSYAAPMPGPLQAFSIGYYQGQIYVWGGLGTLGNQTELWSYQVATNTWTTNLAPVPMAVSSSGYGVIGGRLFNAGSLNSQNPSVPQPQLYSYSVAANSWRSRAPLPTDVYAPGSAVANNNLWLFGGVGSLGVPDSTTQIYNLLKNSWSYGPSLNVGRAGIGGAHVGNYLIAIGGFDQSRYGVTTTEVLVVGTATAQQ